IKEKGFSMNLENSTDEYGNNFRSVDFSRIKVGIKNLDDAIVTLGDYKKVNSRLSDKQTILQAINNYDLDTMRDASNFFYRISGIYSRLCRYMAYLYRYDWMITPYIEGDNMKNGEKALSEFNKALLFFDNSELKRLFGEIALKVLRNGCYYGYLIPSEKRMSIQELPVKYCRTRYSVNGRPAIEFNMKFFDDYYRDTVQRMKILNLFPAEFKKGYSLYKQGKLVPDFQGDTSGWYLLDPSLTIKFNVNGEDFPALISVIPAIIDLDEAQELDRKKMAQQLLKIIIQKMPMDKNGDLVFDVDEAKELHNNAVQMLGKAIGIDVLTTFADVEVADMADKSTTTTTDELEKVERTVYNESGTAQNLFNTDGNIALEKSILNDEAAMYNLLLQFESFLNDILTPFNKSPKKVFFRAQILTTTIYNYKEMAKLYKEQTQLGYSKMLPQIALGQSQSSILANAFFENDILDLVHVFIPPLMSSTMNAEILGTSKNGSSSSSEDNKVGRKEKEDDQKSEKTIANRESMS
uniref:hypothetical protein n=1 Tax=Methanobrevibacter ruminantium TaxID=83816 RepID=UPI002D80E07B